MKFDRKIAMCMAVIALLCATWACKKDNNNNNNGNGGNGGNPPPPPVVAKHDIRLATDEHLGSILTDSNGKTLYFFSVDANGSSGCTGNCLTAWPVFYRNTPTLDSGLNAADFGTITRGDGASQTTYKGWPLYYYQPDEHAGDVKGEAVGKVWYVAKPDYTVMLANTQLVGNDGVQYDSTLKAGTGVTQYITDPYGKTLYKFSKDAFRKNNFTKSDFSNNGVWPIDSVAKVLRVPSIMDKTQFDTLMVFGKPQLVYKGWPLYYFGSDAARGQTKGVSVPTPGIWPYVNAYSAAAAQ